MAYNSTFNTILKYSCYSPYYAKTSYKCLFCKY